jgi:hypothetical protein
LADGHCAVQQDGGPADDDAHVIFMPDSGRPDGGARCLPSQDGVVQRSEAPFGPGLMVRYTATGDVPVSTAGSDLGDGRRRWDLSVALPGDHALEVATAPLDGAWFADSFPTGDYYAQLSEASDLLGVFRVTDTALELLGVVSPTDGLYRTELTYDPPVRVLVFPLRVGSAWQSDSVVSGLAQGLFATYTESYESTVDTHGEVLTPYAPFEALRVRTTLTRNLTISITTVRQYLFVAECFGTIATIVSEDNETQTEFTQAAELRRLGF